MGADKAHRKCTEKGAEIASLGDLEVIRTTRILTVPVSMLSSARLLRTGSDQSVAPPLFVWLSLAGPAITIFGPHPAT